MDKKNNLYYNSRTALAEELNQSAITTRPQRHCTMRNSGKYIGRRSKGVITREKIMNEL